MIKNKQALIFQEEVPDELLEDFLTLRKAKRAPLTQTALNGIAREAAMAGMTLAEALTACCENGWQGFRAAWVAENKQTKNGVTHEKNRTTHKPSLCERATNARKETERRIAERWPHGEFMGEDESHLSLQMGGSNGRRR